MKRKQILNYSLIFGSLAGFACFLLFLGMYYVIPNPLNYKIPYIGIHIILIWAAIWYFKRNNGGYLHFYEAFSVGFLTNIIAALISGLSIYLFVEFVDLTPFTTWINDGKAMMIDKKAEMVKIMGEENHRNNLLSLSNSKPITIFYDNLIYKQFSIIPISLLSMAMRKLKN